SLTSQRSVKMLGVAITVALIGPDDVRVSLNGRALASQARYAGSIPVTRSVFLAVLSRYFLFLQKSGVVLNFHHLGCEPKAARVFKYRGGIALTIDSKPPIIRQRWLVCQLRLVGRCVVVVIEVLN